MNANSRAQQLARVIPLDASQRLVFALMTMEEDFIDELARARDLHREYVVTVRALAVTVERLLKVTGGDSVEISDGAINTAPDLKAWRNDARKTVEIVVSRDNPATG